MDSLTSRARHIAWSGDGVWTVDRYNPWLRRRRPQRRGYSVEAGRTHGSTHSLSSRPSTSAHGEQRTSAGVLPSPSTDDASAYERTHRPELGHPQISTVSDDADADAGTENVQISAAIKSARRRRKWGLSLSSSVASELRALLFPQLFTINWLFVLVPLGFAAHYARWSAPAVFAINFVALAPSGSLLSFATEELKLYLGELLGGLLSNTFSNAVLLITSIFLLLSKQIAVLQASLLGVMLTNILLMTGISLVAGGCNRVEQMYRVSAVDLISTYLVLSLIALLLPTACKLIKDPGAKELLQLSRGTAVVIIISYVLWLLFQLRTHRQVFDEPVPKVRPKRTNKLALLASGTGAESKKGREAVTSPEVPDEEDGEEPQLSRLTAIATIVITTTLVAFNAQFAADSVQGLMDHAGISPNFTGVVILPLINMEPACVVMAIKDKLDLTIALTWERCMQTSLMVIPFLVLLDWWIGINAMTLVFDGFLVIALFVAVLITTRLLSNGRTHWLEGALLIEVYLIIAIAAFFIR